MRPFIGIAIALACATAATNLEAQVRDTTAAAVDRVFDAHRGTDVPGCAALIAR